MRGWMKKMDTVGGGGIRNIYKGEDLFGLVVLFNVFLKLMVKIPIMLSFRFSFTKLSLQSL